MATSFAFWIRRCIALMNAWLLSVLGEVSGDSVEEKPCHFFGTDTRVDRRSGGAVCWSCVGARGVVALMSAVVGMVVASTGVSSGGVVGCISSGGTDE